MVDKPNAKPERNLAIWQERKEVGTTLRALAKKHGLTFERIRQIVAKEDRRIERLAYFDGMHKQKEGATHGG
jgi:DNA-directed RNA polymerase sigma subunit (sigma70/sigma32)